jgi:tripartite-type tricarboxylate transporter receptor subunit TctC
VIENVGSSSTSFTTRSPTSRAAGASATSQGGATDQLNKAISDLRSTDQKVKAHEQAHAAAGGPYAGAIQLTYTKGPDGKEYAVAGEVSIDTSPERDPDATIKKMETVKQAALAPADPSSQDRAVAQQAEAQEAQARNEKSKQSGKNSGVASASARATAAYGNAASIGGTSSTYSTSA